MVDEARSAAAGAGQVLAGAARAVAALRTAEKPLHPRGTMWSGALVRHGGSSSGVHWLDEPGTDSAVVRLSRAVGLPGGWPDVHGLAVRVLGEDGSQWLTSCSRRPAPARSGASSSTSDAGRMRCSSAACSPTARPRAPSRSAPCGATTRRGTCCGRSAARPGRRSRDLVLWERTPAEDISFDPVLNRPPGFEQYDALARLRLPAYRTARRTRGDSIAEPLVPPAMQNGWPVAALMAQRCCTTALHEDGREQNGLSHAPRFID